MILHCFSIKDRINGFAPPIPFVHETYEKAAEHAIRDFWERYNSNTTVHYAPEDFELWHLGTFDTESGTIIQTKKDIKCILKGEQFTNGSNKNTLQNSLQRTNIKKD